MENHEEKQSDDAVEGKITFASHTVLAAILDGQSSEQGSAYNMVDLKDQGQNSDMVYDSLDASLTDSLEVSKLPENGQLESLDRVATEELMSLNSDNENANLEVSDFPKSSTTVKNNSELKSRNVEKPPKPRRSQHIIERNKVEASKRSPAKTSYAQMHATKARSKLDNMEKKLKTRERQTVGYSSDSNVDKRLINEEDINDLNQNSYFENHVSQFADLNNTCTDLDEQENYLLEESYLNGSINRRHTDHGPYYHVGQNYSTEDASYLYDPVSYTRGYQSAGGHLRQSQAVTDPVPQLPYSNLSTQSAPPGVYGYHREPLITSLHHFSEEDYHLSSVLPNSDFVSYGRRDKIPESSLHRKFPSEPYLAQSSSPLLQKMANADRNSRVSGSYSSLRQPFAYKPYTLKDYKNFVGSKVKPLAGGLGPNVDTKDFKEKMKKVSKQREYATMLRSQHSTMKKQQQKRATATLAAKPHHVQEAEIKRQAALNYAKNVPKPKPMASRKRENSGSGRHWEETRGDEDQEITVLEILRMRHEKEKQEVDSIRKDLASKIRL